MPVAPCFDPTTGASGGAAPGASASLYNLAPIAVDLTDGTWTLEDPDGLVDTVSYAAGFNTITFNTLAAPGNNTYRWDNGTTCRAPRWYRALEIDGSAVFNTDALVMMTRVELDETKADFNQKNVFGAGLDATSVTASTIALTGGYWALASLGGNPIYGGFTINAQTSTGNANNAYGLSNIMRAGDGLGGVTYSAMSSADLVLGANARNSGVTSSGAAIPTGVQLIVGVGPGLNTTGITAGDQVGFKASYIAFTGNVGA